MSNRSVLLIDRTFSDATTPAQSGPGSDGNKGVLCIPPKLQHYWSLVIRLFHHKILQCHIQDNDWGVLLLFRDAVDVFNCPSRPLL